MNIAWNPDTYSQFLDLRTRPAKDLLAAIPSNFYPTIVYDLGCGPGNSTVLLKNRWPEAEVIGIDNSGEMLAEARRKYPQITFREEDIQYFSVREKIDCLFANASLQWLPYHEQLIPKLLANLTPGGYFAFQMPNNFHCPSHQVAIEA